MNVNLHTFPTDLDLHLLLHAGTSNRYYFYWSGYGGRGRGACMPICFTPPHDTVLTKHISCNGNETCLILHSLPSLRIRRQEVLLCMRCENPANKGIYSHQGTNTKVYSIGVIYITRLSMQSKTFTPQIVSAQTLLSCCVGCIPFQLAHCHALTVRVLRSIN